MSDETPTPNTDPRLAVALARAERRLELLQELAAMGMALTREINQRFIEGPQRAEPRPDPSRAYAAVSRAVRLAFILEARTEKQILAWRKGDLSSLGALAPEPFLAPRFDPPAERRARVRDCVAAVIDREALDPCEAEWMRGRVQRELIETEDLDDHRLKGGFRDCVEAICADLGLKPDWSRWSDDHGFDVEADVSPRPPAQPPPTAPSRRNRGCSHRFPSPLAGEGGGEADG